MAKKPSLRDRMQKRKEDLKKGAGGNFDTFIFSKEGTIRMRHLPVPEDAEPGVELVQFYIGGDVKAFISPASFNEPCACMEAYNKLSKKSDDKSKKLAKRLKPKRVFGVPSIRYNDLQGKEPDHGNGAKLAICKPGQYQDLVELWLDEDEAGDFTNPKTGYDIKHTREGKGQFDTTYSVRPCKPTPLDKKYAKQVYDPTEMAKALIPTYEQTKEYLSQFMAMPEDDDAPEEAPKKKKKKSKDL